MATSDWAIPTGKAITGATYIKDTDDYISATIEDLVDWCNNANGTYNDWTLTGLRTDFLTKTSAQTLTAVTTVDTLGAIDFTGGELRIGGTAVTSTAAELNLLDGVTSTTAELNILDGVTSTTEELNILDGVTATTSELNILDGVTATATELNQLSGVTLSSGTYVATMTGNINISVTNNPTCMYTRIGNVVTVSAKLYFETVAGDTQTRLSLTLPVASNFTSTIDCIGVGNWWPAGTAVKSDAGTIRADTTNNVAIFDCTAADSSAPYIQEYFVTFQYIVK